VKALIEKLQAGQDLNYDEVRYAVSVLLSPDVTAGDKAAFLRALHLKGESAGEIAGFVEQLIGRAVDPQLDPAKLPGPMIDVCGTGGDGLEMFNVSTTVMFIVAAGGAVVVKHGNRGVTSRCGSADVLEALGIRIEWSPEEFRACVEQLGLGFIFARQYHPAFAALAEMRAQLAREKTRTIFNLLGPLLNPARPDHQLIGVYTPRMTTVFAEVLQQLGRKKAWIVHGLTETGAGMDDISISGATTLAELDRGKITSAVIDCGSLGIPRGTTDELRGGDADENARTLVGILSGEVRGAKRDLTIANAAGAFVAAGLAPEMAPGIAMAEEQIDSGRALAKLRAFQEFSAGKPA
jgi:anthranilate phosphoribosyltransferase